MTGYPKNYQLIHTKYPKLMKALEDAGKAAKKAGPVDVKTGHLIQLAASVALRSEGGVHSHVRRALKAGAKEEEIYHTIALLISTVGFPTAAAAFSWVSDVIEKKTA